MKDYKIIKENRFMNQTEGNVLEMLESAVKVYISLGYVPIGSPMKYEGGFAQAMYKDDIR